ncbi:MAG: hypothetical protein AAF614_01730 [Chloroflexota bacterium]
MSSYNKQGVIENYSVDVSTTAGNWTPQWQENASTLITIKGSFGIAFLKFVRAGAPIKMPKERGRQGVFDVYYEASIADTMIDILRNESPVRFYYFEMDSFNSAGVTTGDEQPGEEESSS